MTSERKLFEGRGMRYPGFSEMEAVLFKGYRSVRKKKHQCPGDLVRGCGVWIPESRLRCYFCTKTIEMRLAAK